MSSEDTQKRLNENYRLIPMKDITDEARDIAVMWVDGYRPMGSINLEQKHKLASDIMNYAALHAKNFAEWLAEMTEVSRRQDFGDTKGTRKSNKQAGAIAGIYRDNFFKIGYSPVNDGKA